MHVKKGASKVESSDQSYKDLSSVSLKPHTTYELSFDYLPSCKLADFKFGTNDGYYVNLVSDKTTKQILLWQDVSGEKGSKTILFTTPDSVNLKLESGSKNFGSLKIDNIRVQETASYVVDFENTDLTSNGDFVVPSTGVSISNEKSARIDGKSLYAKIKKKSKTNVLSTNSNTMKLKADTVYTVSFDFRAESDVGNGGYYYVNLSSKKLNKDFDVGEWYQRPDYPSQTYTYTFKTGNSDDFVMSLGVYKNSVFSLDNVTLIEMPDGVDVSDGATRQVAVNQPRTITKTMPADEGFESGSFAGTMFDMGANNWGKLTTAKNEVISGSYSLLGRAETSEEWFEFAHSRTDVLKLEPNASYRVSFNYKILKNLAQKDGFFYFFARTAKGSFTDDKGFYSWTGSAGETGHKTIDFTLGNFEQYYLSFGARWGGEISIDDVHVEKLPTAKAFSGTIDFENGSVALSNCLSSTVNGPAGDIITRKDLVIDGKYSLFGENTTSSMWYDFLYTDPTKVKLQPNTTYTVSFEYKVIKETMGDNFFQFFARSDTGGVKNDKGTLTFTSDAMKVGKKTVTFTTGNFTDYKLAFGMKGKGAIVIDDIQLTEK